MKTIMNKAALFGLTTGLAALSLLFGGVSQSKAAPFDSPVSNDWDCIGTGGGQNGIFFLHFDNTPDPTNNNMFQFNGISIQAGNRGTSSSSGGGRNSGGDPGRGTGGGSTNAIGNVFG